MPLSAVRRRGCRAIALGALLGCTCYLLLSFLLVSHSTDHPTTINTRDAAGGVIRYSSNLPTPLARTSPSERRSDACLLFITRTVSLTKVRRTLYDVQRRFNDRFGYPVVFLSEEPFSDDFQAAVRYMVPADQDVHFGLIPDADWDYPEWVDRQRARQMAEAWANSNELAVDRAGWRHMVRYWAGPFALHPLLASYRYVWRLEPGSHYTCDLITDPLAQMQPGGLQYMFSIAFEEMPDALPTLAQAAREFVAENPDLFSYPQKQNALGWLFDARGFNHCQFLTNSEIVDLDFVRSDPYQRLFAFLDRKAGIYYERWTDATVRSLAVAMFLSSTQARWIHEAGYRHDQLNNCPSEEHLQKYCHCDPLKSTHLLPFSCAARWNSTAYSIDPNSI
ncbi:hypothetical protein GGI07_003853 [Coemansia sp. Benny D115]|nr:hypothetical protein GGI07_003853 [Coemansia sp. Benny D115]